MKIHHRLRWHHFLLGLFFGLIGLAAVRGQCLTPSWQPATGFRGVDGKVNDLILWDRDGQGGEPPVMVAGGGFSIAGTTFANNVAVWNGTTWEALGTGTNGEVYELLAMPNGDLVAGGLFSKCGDLLVNRVARWDGKAWTSLAGGVQSKPPLTTSDVSSLAVLPNGDLVVAGFFYSAGGMLANSIARWNGSAWSALGTGLTATSLATPVVMRDLIVMPNGDLVASGGFDTAGGTAAKNIARWDGQQWSALGTGGSLAPLALLPNGDLLAGGVARWDGVAWQRFGGAIFWQGVNSSTKVIVLPNGDLIASSDFTASATPSFISRWNGTAWEAVGTGLNNAVFSVLRLPNGDIVAGGYFNGTGSFLRPAGSTHVSGLAHWDGANWNIFGSDSGIGGRVTEPRTDLHVVYATARLPNGNIVIGGRFLGAGRVNASYIAGWTGKAWYPLGAGLNGDVLCLAVLANGDVIAGGAFTKSGDVSISAVARWDGKAWTAVGGGVGLAPARVDALAIMPNGDLVVTGSFSRAGTVAALGLARWSWQTETWSKLGTVNTGGASSLLGLSNGDLIFGGTVSGTGSVGIARWDGAKWNGLGTGLNGFPRSLAVLPNGDLVAAGGFGTAGGTVTGSVARWDGAKWSRFGTKNAPGSNVMTILANGRIVIGGSHRPSDITTNHVAEWDGTNWVTLGMGTDRFLGEVHALTALPEGGFVVGGRFTSMNGQVAVHFAHWGCPFETVVATAPPSLRGVGLGSKGLRFQLQGSAAKTYEVEYSADLRSWLPVQAGLLDQAIFEDTDQARRAATSGFYRAVER